MKLYLDTNILVFSFLNREELSIEVKELMEGYANILQTSILCVHELIHLCQIGKLEEGKKKRRNVMLRPEEILERIEDVGIEIVPVSKRHLSVYASLPLMDDHKDPVDRLIIAQAIADRTALISSDRKFSKYKDVGLDFIYNER
ncbi:MAG TPA: type II toxin-antitoxin system VapC family toxin [Candidatus Parabacteroides intestinigallinarum]|uniref:Type II toxin-antitoxin system VapC family toxin n=1 Tax=Candidatus Parabacteroides intestinigallinarum TaxID=2838722 RepID=A0A9D1XRE2_9BACT|nr:type II toxin-antitoxin system VapC family toxin [Candidatus Parabacteroides intestinigallinarum]